MRWRTDHTLAWCCGTACKWHQRAERDDPPSKHAAAVRAGVEHASATGHTVTYERGQFGTPARPDTNTGSQHG